MTTDITADGTGTSFVVYVPPDAATPDPSVESCFRLGATHADENATYHSLFTGAPSFLHLSDYSPATGATLITNGTINFMASQGVNTTAGSTSSSTIGETYAVTLDPDKIDASKGDDNNHKVITAALTTKQYGSWSTTSFTKAQAFSVNDNIAGTFGSGATYAYFSGAGFTNGLAATFASNVGIAVSAPLALNVNIGNDSVTTSWPFGDTFQYQEEATTTARSIKLVVDSSLLNPKLALFTGKKKALANVIKAASIAVEAALLAYSAGCAAQADGGHPDDVKGWLSSAEGLTIACTVVNAILCAAGTILGIIQLATCETPGDLATSVHVGDGAIELTTGKLGAVPLPTLNMGKTTGFSLQTGAVNLAPALTIVPGTTPAIALAIGAPTAPRVDVDKDSVKLKGNTGKANVSLADSALTLAFGATGTITVDASGITITAGANSLVVSNSGVTINGTSVAINSPQTKVTPAPLPPKVTPPPVPPFPAHLRKSPKPVPPVP